MVEKISKRPRSPSSSSCGRQHPRGNPNNPRVLASEEIVRQRPPAGEEFDRQLALEDQLEGGETEAGLRFGQRIELLHAARENMQNKR